MATNKGSEDSTKERYTFFWMKDSPFSQWHSCEFTVDGVVYNCAEQYMMHQKAVVFKDQAMADKIMTSDSPKDQKAYGRQVSNFDAKVWNEKSREVVKDGNYAKFSQNEELWEAMAATVGTVLVEASPRDRIWGIGLGAKNPKAQRKATWRGKNWLGYCLTEVRERILGERSGAEKGATGTGNETEGKKDRKGKTQIKGEKRKRSPNTSTKPDDDDVKGDELS